MTATYVAGTSIGRVRLLITDTNTADAIFTDEEINDFLSMEGDSVLYAAAMALETIGTSEALTSKVIRLLDLSTDGRAVSAELRARAATLRERADKLEAAEDDGGFDIADTAVNAFGYRQRVYNEALRNL